MTAPYFTAAQHRRRARLLTALVVVLALGVPLAVVVSGAQASYNHASACRDSLRGGGGSDDDIHALGLATYSTGFSGWEVNSSGAFVVSHASDGSVYMRGVFTYSGGRWRWYTGHCWGGDYGPDHFIT